MIKSTIFAFTALAATASQACMLDPNQEYDDFADPSMAIIVANVTAFEIEFSEQNGACWHAEYQTLEQIKGQMPVQFSTQYCQEMSAETFSSTFADEAFLEVYNAPNALGFSKGAKVLLGVMPDPSGTTGYTWAAPTCWGPFHLNLEYDMSPTAGIFGWIPIDRPIGLITRANVATRRVRITCPSHSLAATERSEAMAGGSPYSPARCKISSSTRFSSRNTRSA